MRDVTVMDMKTLSAYTDGSLVLHQPSLWKREYHLRAGEEVICTMKQKGSFGSTVVIEGFGGAWVVSRPHWWRSDLNITRADQHLPFATFACSRWESGGLFSLPNGERIQLVQSIWKSVNELHSAQKVRLVSLKRPAWWKRSLHVVIDQSSDVLDRHPWIVMVTYHLILMRQRQAS